MLREEQVSAGGIFRPTEGATFASDQIAYLVAFESVAQRDSAWQAFVADEEWQRLKKESEREGPLVQEESFYLLQPTDFSVEVL